MIFLQAIPAAPAVGDLAPNVVFHRANGTSLALKSLRGQIVVLEFTSLKCPPCRELAPKLEEFAASRLDVVFLTISVDPPANLARLASLRGKNARTELVQDDYNAERSKMAVWKFGNVASPTLFLIGKDGKFASKLMQNSVDSLPHLAERIEWARKQK